MVTYLQALIDMYAPRATKGQGMVEYGLILVLVAIAAIVALGLLGDELSPIFDEVTTALQSR